MMTLNLALQLLGGTLAVATLWFWRLPNAKRVTYDRWLFWCVSALLVAFAAFRPLGVGVDDGGYNSSVWGRSCPSFACGQWWQGSRDQVWYSLVGLLKSIYPYPPVVLWLAGLGLAVKLWVMDRLCRHRSLALLFYVSCFYLIHDITALRVSLAISVYLLGFYCLVRGRWRWGAGLLVVNGFFHQQAFLAPLLLLGRWFPWTPVRLTWALLLPLVLLTMAVYPNDALLKWLVAQPFGTAITDVLFGQGSSYLGGKLAGGYDQVRIWPVVAPPTLLLVAWLLPDLLRLRDKSLFRYAGTSLAIAAWLLWGYAVIPEVQLRFWHFFLVPIVFVIGNAQLTRRKLVAILALSTVYLLKYTVMHDLLLDQRQVHWESPVGGRIALQTPAIACGEGCGFNVTQGTAATLQATPNAGYRFAGWSGACAGAEPVCTVTVEDDVSVGAQFVKTVAVSAQWTGSGTLAAAGQAPCTAACDWHPDVGAELALTATPAEGWRFSGWGGACAGGEARCVMKVESDQPVTATFVQVFPIHLTTGPGGTVEGLPAGAGDCAVGCDRTVDAGTALTLQAVPAPSYRFTGWSGACQGQDTRCTVTAKSALTVGATFTLKHTVAVPATELGTVLAATRPETPPAPGPWLADEGAVLPLTPLAQPGARFDHWTAGCVGTGLCLLTVTQDLTVSAAFRPLSAYPLRLTVRGQGQVSSEPAGLACGPASAGSCRGVFSDVTLRAKPAAGFVFRRWVGCAAGSHPVCTTTLRRAATLTAEFVPVPRHEVKLAVSGPGAVQGLVDGTPCMKGARACRALVMQGGEVTLTAVPEEGHFFVGWSGACAGRAVTCRVPVEGEVGVDAEFQ